MTLATRDAKYIMNWKDLFETIYYLAASIAALEHCMFTKRTPNLNVPDGLHNFMSPSIQKTISKEFETN